MFVDKSRRFVWKRNANKPRGEDLSRDDRLWTDFYPVEGEFDLTLKSTADDDSRVPNPDVLELLLSLLVMG